MVHIDTHPRVLVHTDTSAKLTLEQAVLTGTEAKARLRLAVADDEDLELNDIFESVDHQNVKHVVAGNIEYVLRREGAITKDMSVVIPEGGYYYDLGEDPANLPGFDGRFDIHSKEGIVATGSVAGQIAFDELLSIHVWINEVR